MHKRHVSVFDCKGVVKYSSARPKKKTRQVRINIRSQNNIWSTLTFYDSFFLQRCPVMLSRLTPSASFVLHYHRLIYCLIGFRLSSNQSNSQWQGQSGGQGQYRPNPTSQGPLMVPPLVESEGGV